MVGKPTNVWLLVGSLFLVTSFAWLLLPAEIVGIVGFAIFVACGLLALVQSGGRPVLPFTPASEPDVFVSSEQVPVGGDLIVTYEQKWRGAADVRRTVVQLVLRESVTYTS